MSSFFNFFERPQSRLFPQLPAVAWMVEDGSLEFRGVHLLLLMVSSFKWVVKPLKMVRYEGSPRGRMGVNIGQIHDDQS